MTPPNDNERPRQPRWTESSRRREVYRPDGSRPRSTQPDPDDGSRWEAADDGSRWQSADEADRDGESARPGDTRRYDAQTPGRHTPPVQPPRDATRVMPTIPADSSAPARSQWTAAPRPQRPDPTWSDGRAASSSVPPSRPAPAPGGASRLPSARRVSAPHRRRRILALLALLVVAWLVFLVVTPFHAWSQVARTDVAPTGDRPAAGVGTNFLLVGSDSRLGMTEEEKQDLATGSDEGARTDSIIMVHVPGGGGGKATMVSIPRDSYVPIPGHSKNKINAAYSIGGPKLLVDTVEQSTGVRLDGYVEIGFVGFAHLVDALGGVTIDVPFDMNDPRAGINLKKGTQQLTGAQALGFVRSRYTDPEGDLGRAKRQRQFLAAIMSKAMSPSTVLLPTRYWNFTHTAADSVQLGEGTSMMEVYQMLQVMRGAGSGDTVSVAVPASNLAYQTRAGTAVKWDSDKAKELFNQIKQDTVPAPN